MDPIQIIFIVVALVVLAAAVMVVTTPNLVRAALWLVLALFGTAGAYVLLNAGFIAVAQVVIYIGAISILMIFAVMLTRRVMTDSGPQTHQTWWLPALLSAALFAGLVWMLSGWSGFEASMPAYSDANQVVELGVALVSPEGFLIPFEVASVLLSAALIGAIYVAWDRD
jgi:NADH-quinone oxidoreductase subunit J